MAQTIVALRTFFRDHLGHSWALWKTVRVRRVENLPVVLTREETANLISKARHRRFQTLFRLIYHCGLRLGEAIRLSPCDIETKSARIRIRHAKGGKERYVPVTAAMVDELRVFWLRHRNPRWLFPGLGRGWKSLKGTAEEAAARSRQHVSEAAVHIAFQKCVAEAGLTKNAVVHTLRHSYATHLLEEGVSIRLISQYLGHASLDTTVIYTHLTAISEEKTREALQRLHGALTGIKA
jgi:site-specific recombinase XerD